MGSNPVSTSSNTGFSFAQTPASTASSSAIFQFGATSTSIAGFSFGTTTNPLPAFGSTNQTPAFGASHQAPAFGTTNQIPAFGGSTYQSTPFESTNQATPFGSSTNQPTPFGSSTNQAPAFGSSTNQAPGFGSSNQALAFGSSTTQATVFGAPTPTFGAHTSSNSVFGVRASTQQTNVFGAPANNTITSAFDSNTSGSLGFGKSHSMPSFGTNNSSTTGTFNFGNQLAPNVNPFGQGPTTPAKQVGSNVGAMNNASTPQKQTGAVFGFGQNGNNSVKKGFGFSAAACGSDFDKMASGSQLINKGSEEVFDTECDPCRAQGTISDGRAYCTVCAEYMCTTCEKAHRGSKLSRDHKIVTGSKMPSMNTTPVLPIMYCEHHKTMMSDLYCVSHDVVICDTCKLTEHRKCEITDVSQQTKRIEVDAACDTTLKQITALKENYEKVIKIRNADKKNVKVKVSKAIQDCKELRKQMNKVFDNLENAFTKEAAIVETRTSKEIENHLTIANDALGQINDKIKSLIECRKSSDDDVMFVGMKKADALQSKYQDAFSTLEQEMCAVEIKFKPNDVITDILLQLPSLGTIQQKLNSTSSTSSQIQQSHVTSDIRSHVSLLNMTASKMQEIDVGSRDVLDSTFIRDRHLLLACGGDGLKLLDKDFKVQSQLPDRSLGVATINDNEVIISQGKMKQLKRVRIFPNMVVNKTIKMTRKCYGVDVFRDEIYVTCHDNPGNGEIQVLDMTGQLNRRIGVSSNGEYMFSRPNYVRVSRDGTRVVMSDFDTHRVTCLSPGGQVLYQYDDGELRAPVGLYIGHDGAVMVCGGNSHNLHIITQDGRKHKVVSTQKDGLRLPCSIAYRPRDGRLVVGLGNADKALVVYKT